MIRRVSIPIFLSVLLCFLFSSNTLLFAQQERNCHAMEVLEQQQLANPEIIGEMERIEQHTQKYVERHIDDAQKVNGLITIPVVVHVIYSNSSENISEAQIMSQMTVLNDDFRRNNSDANNNWSQAADMEIEFCLASVDPNGNATSGITRKSSSKTSWGTNDDMKKSSRGGVDPWPTGDYLNMWVCNIGGGILGYAQFPGGSAATDGVVMSPQYFGTIGSAQAPFDGGRTTTHEVGHWLNLRHIWGDGACGADDFVSDTPTSDAANYGCASNHSSCNSLDMVQNYMDYSDDACMNLFTAGQKTRMRALFGAGGSRASLLNSGGCGNGGGGTTASCNDGIQNQGETGVDCGGPCTACQSSCTENDITITITFDNYPEETSWTLTDASGATIGSGGTYADQADGSTITLTGCLADGCYDFTINDAYGDGICCSYGNGSYTISDATGTLASGGSFGSSETKNFCLGGGSPPPPPAETCNDGIQNQGETGVDCGGPCTACASCNDGIQNQGETGVDCGGPCSACPTCNDGIQNQGETGVDCGGPCSPCDTGGSDCITVDTENFESGWGIWNDGGSDCYRNNYATYASSGSYTIRIRDNSGAASSMTTDNLSLNGYGEATVDFHFYAVSMESGEDFWLDVSLDGGATWYDGIVSWASGTDFNNNTSYNESITITGGYSSSTKFRFRCDASANADKVYIDDVTITACVGGARLENGDSPLVVTNRQSIELASLNATARDINNLTEELTVFPNPSRDVLNVAFQTEATGQGQLMVMDLSGKLIDTREVQLDGAQQRVQFDVNSYAPGSYFVTLVTEEERLTQKFIVLK